MNSSKRNIWKYVFWSGILLITLFEGIRDVQRDGDFAGYVEAGTAVLQSQPLYENYLNTWPPFFSVFSVPLAWMDAVSPLWNRIIWFLGSVLAFGFVLISVELVILGKAEKHWKQRLWSSTTILAFLGVLRFYMDNLSNLQINMYLLAGCLLAWYWHKKDKNFLAGLVLAFCISLKVYPMFLMLFLPFIRKWRFFSWSVFFCAVFALVPYLVFGVDQATAYYADFYNTRILGGPLVTHRNQSLWSFLDGLLTAQSRGLDLRYNVASLSSERARMVSLGIIFLLLLPCLRWVKSSYRNGPMEGYLVSFVLGAIPLLSPLAWKYYFIFLFPAYYLVIRSFLQGYRNTWTFSLLMVSFALCTLTTDGIWGKDISDIFQLYGCVTFGAIALLIALYTVIQKEHASLTSS
jgi:hypothetical protein